MPPGAIMPTAAPAGGWRRLSGVLGGQFAARCLSALVNVLILPLVAHPSVYGVGNIQYFLVQSASLFLAKEAMRKMCLRRTDTPHPATKEQIPVGGGARDGEVVSRVGDMTHLADEVSVVSAVNASWLSAGITAATAISVCSFAIVKELSVPSTQTLMMTGQDEHHHGISSAVMRISYLLGFAIVGMAAVLEGCAEPFLVITVIRGNYGGRLRAESVALVSKTIYLGVASVGFLLWDSLSPIQPPGMDAATVAAVGAAIAFRRSAQLLLLFAAPYLAFALGWFISLRAECCRSNFRVAAKGGEGGSAESAMQETRAGRVLQLVYPSRSLLWCRISTTEPLSTTVTTTAAHSSSSGHEASNTGDGTGYGYYVACVVPHKVREVGTIVHRAASLYLLPEHIGFALRYGLLAVQKFLLTEGEKLLLMLFFDSRHWTQFALGFNLSSVVCRVFFAPVEGIAAAEFSRSIPLAQAAAEAVAKRERSAADAERMSSPLEQQPGLRGGEGPPTSTGSSRRGTAAAAVWEALRIQFSPLHGYLYAQAVLGILAATAGPPSSRAAVCFLYRDYERWKEADHLLQL
eukprot:GHVU01025367.1.p1 GENE.GHVU01025367.1~~GHVU01025367.1.p1  ORF type:complete len:576 (-),score=73.03 GHVU01025367.1:161-1888(-)